MGKPNETKLVDQTVEIQDLRSRNKELESKLNDLITEKDQLIKNRETMQKEFQWLASTYNEFVSSVFDNLFEYAGQIKNSKLENILEERKRREKEAAEKKVKANMEKIKKKGGPMPKGVEEYG